MKGRVEFLGIYFLSPALKETIWGGTRLKDEYGMATKLNNIAEAWMLSCHEDGESTVINGEYSGKTLSKLIDDELGIECLGTDCKEFTDIDDFPILIKLIDASDNLSIQVHPDDEYAAKNEKDIRGKTEAWYIIDCDENSELIYGFKDEISSDEFRTSISDGTLLDKVNRVKVKPGDVAFIPSGTLHAIGKGILLAEVQQSCNTTYRVYDYNRPGLDGKPRQLHIDKAAAVTNCVPPGRSLEPDGMPVKHDGYISVLLTASESYSSTLVYFTTLFADPADDNSFVAVIVLDGNGKIQNEDEEYNINKGDSIFIPADSGSYYISGQSKLLITRV